MTIKKKEKKRVTIYHILKNLLIDANKPQGSSNTA